MRSNNKKVNACFVYLITHQYLLMAYTFSTICCINIRSTTITTIIRTSFIICFILAITITNVKCMLIHAACKPRNQHHMSLKSRKNICFLILKVKKSRAGLGKYFHLVFGGSFLLRFSNFNWWGTIMIKKFEILIQGSNFLYM